MSHPVSQQNVFIIIPAYQEHAIIHSVIQELAPLNYNLVVIDDGSVPPLYPFLNKLPIYFLRHNVNLGQGAALQTGIEFALMKRADLIVTFDADGQHQPKDIPILLNALKDSDADIALGSRFIGQTSHNMPGMRKATLQFARYVNYIFTGLLLTDAHNGLRAMTRKAAATLQIRENGMAHATEIISQIKKRKLHYTEVPVHIFYSAYSRKKGQTIWNSFRIFFDILLNKIFR